MGGDVVTHRVVDIVPAENGQFALTLRGDANKQDDPERYLVTGADRLIASTPELGRWLMWMRVHPIPTAAVLLALLAFSLWPNPRFTVHHPDGRVIRNLTRKEADAHVAAAREAAAREAEGQGADAAVPVPAPAASAAVPVPAALAAVPERPGPALVSASASGRPRFEAPANAPATRWNSAAPASAPAPRGVRPGAPRAAAPGRLDLQAPVPPASPARPAGPVPPARPVRSAGPVRPASPFQQNSPFQPRS
jgi:hypothetical protein